MESAKFPGVWEDWEKSMLENDMPPLETSGTPEIVVVEVSHVTGIWMLLTESWTSAGRVTEPITKQAVARREGWGGDEFNFEL